MPGYVGLFSCTNFLLRLLPDYGLRRLRDCPVMSGFFHTLSSKMKQLTLHLQVIARLCRAFFMHSVVVMTLSWHFWTQLMIARYVGLFSCTTSYPSLKDFNTLFSDCPVMSGFFHALSSQELTDTSIPL